jgi:alpha-beta hydrolase superfamily lysophospholipase
MMSTAATYVLIHGAGDVGWYWHLVQAELRGHGHDVVVMDLPVDDDSAGLSAYADVPAAWVRRVVRDRLGITSDEIDSGHTPALSHPSELVRRLETYRAPHPLRTS